MKLFDRVIELWVGETYINGLDISFEIEKDLSPEPNPSHIEIYNLSQKNRETLSKYKTIPVLLKAGYKDDLGIIFNGDLISCSHIKEGPNWKTVLASGDGVLAIQTARINKSFARNTSVKKVIEEIAKQLNLPSESVLKQLENLTEKLPRGFSLCGNAMDELKNLLAPYDYGVSVQNNTLQILKHGAALKNQAISLSADSGLKGTPQVGRDKTLQIESVLMPELLPGSKIHIDSLVYNGFAVIQKVRFVGDNFGESWGSEVVGTIRVKS